MKYIEKKYLIKIPKNILLISDKANQNLNIVFFKAIKNKKKVVKNGRI